jgi:hypothetical protein
MGTYFTTKTEKTHEPQPLASDKPSAGQQCCVNEKPCGSLPSPASSSDQNDPLLHLKSNIDSTTITTTTNFLMPFHPAFNISVTKLFKIPFQFTQRKNAA